MVVVPLAAVAWLWDCCCWTGKGDCTGLPPDVILLGEPLVSLLLLLSVVADDGIPSETPLPS